MHELAKLGSQDIILPSALKPRAVAPPPPADAVPLMAAATDRSVAPQANGRLSARLEDPGLVAFAIALRAPAPARGLVGAEWKRLPAAAPVERMVVARAIAERLRVPQEELALPAFTIALSVPAPTDAAWKPLSAIAPMERVPAPRDTAFVAFPAADACQPTAGCLPMADPASAIVPDCRRAIPRPQMGRTALAAAGPVHDVPISVPAAHQPEFCGYFPKGPEREAPVLPAALSARSLATPVSGRTPAAPPLRLPRFGGGPMPSQGLRPAPFFDLAPPPAEETAMPRHIQQAPVSTVTVRHPKPPEPVTFAVLALAELMPLEYFCSRGPRVHPHGVGWIIPSPPPAAPRFVAPLMVEYNEPLTPVRMEPRKKPSVAEVFRLPEAAALRPNRMRDWGRLIAACLVLGAALWLGTGFLRSDRDSGLALSVDDSGLLRADPVAGRGSGSVFQRVRSAIARRAEVHLNDGFHNGMAAWGAPAQTWAPGWVRHPEGYVTPGKLALYRPTLRFTDYRLEFFGQIETRSLDWAVRASNDANYYAMKFASDGPGPRAVVSMIHYPVVNGKSGARVTTPLSIMIHEHTPYHVEVDVTGDRITTSIEGEEVDSFVDDTLARGGVGFFADAGDQARLYWVRVSGNEDLLGRICALLSGGKSKVAQLAPPAGSSPRPDSGDPANHLAMVAGFGFLRRNRLRPMSNHRRFSTWRF